MEAVIFNSTGENLFLQDEYNLKQVVEQAITSCNKIDNKIELLNDVPEDLLLYNDKAIVSSVLKGLLSSIMREAPGRAIRIAGKIYTNIILLHIKQECSKQTDISIKELQTLALRMNGVLSMTSCRANVTTFAFSFPSTPSFN